ncbi:hypothetical protein ATO1_06995 [Phaeobacter sp. 22II1-1F12B]|nr:hypothetical protein ATO1_06995 [Phaeobacter sp. 22II1-1F12B]
MAVSAKWRFGYRGGALVVLGIINFYQYVAGVELPWHLAPGQQMVGGKWLAREKGHKCTGARFW